MHFPTGSAQYVIEIQSPKGDKSAFYHLSAMQTMAIFPAWVTCCVWPFHRELQQWAEMGEESHKIGVYLNDNILTIKLHVEPILWCQAAFY